MFTPPKEGIGLEISGVEGVNQPEETLRKY
jgi:hypothetical protein